MTTLFVRKAGSKVSRLLNPGGDPARWEVSDGDDVLATGRTWLSRAKLEIDADSRHLTARLPGTGVSHLGLPNELEVVDDATKEKVIDGKLTSGGVTRPRDEEWAVTLPAGGTISWLYKRKQEKVGFYDEGGQPIMRTGHDPSFDYSAKGGTFRMLLRLWGGAIQSADRYLAIVEDDAVGRTVTREELPVLALLSMWLQRTAEADTDVTIGFAA